MTWDPGQYLGFAAPRLRPAIDLLARVGAAAPATIVDLGCGAGNLTALLARRWPGAAVTGVDASPEMLAKAREDHPGVMWVEAELETWEPGEPADVVFSNATLHWLDHHERLFPRIAGWVSPGGWLAVQMPRNHAAPTHRRLVDTVLAGPWAERLAPLLREWPVAEPRFYVDLLTPLASVVDVWETEYLHVLGGADPVVEWAKGSVLRPILGALDDAEAAAFEDDYRSRIRASYPPRPDGRTLLPFKRLFLVARIRKESAQ